MRLTFIGKRDIFNSEFYTKSIENKEDILIHADKSSYPRKLLDIARPKEDPEYKEYRENVYENQTYGFFNKVLNVLQKGRLSEDWSISWPDNEKSSELWDYTQKSYPFFDSIENWFFSLAFKNMLIDANAVVAIYSKPTDNDADRYIPFTHIFECSQVITYEEGEYAELLSTERSNVMIGGAQKQEGRVIYVFDRNIFAKYIQTGAYEKFDYVEEYSIQHNIGYLPVFKLGGYVDNFKNNNILYSSFVSGVVPSWNESVRRYSDHQVNMVLHLHPYEWEIADSTCLTCSGSGKVRKSDLSGSIIESECGKCGGIGKKTVRTPFGKKVIKPEIRESVSGSVSVPTPPAGIISRDIASISFLRDEYKDKIREGLSSINMEFVMNEPNENSGVAKITDKEELHTFVASVYRHIVENILNPCYYFIAKWRFQELPSVDDILPHVNIPTRFDLLTSQELFNQLKAARDGKFSPLIINRLEYDFAKKEFGDESAEAKRIELIGAVDPLPGYSQEDKMVILANRGCTEREYQFSVKLEYLINRAIRIDSDFLSKPYDQQVTTLYRLLDTNE